MSKEDYIDNSLNIIDVNYCEQMEKSYIDYALTVIIERALPDVRDGLKPVHRRILYSMYKLGLLPDKDYRKCARIVGDVLGTTHPHGDEAVYKALVRMAQNFKLREPLIDGHGNFGSIDGDSPAAMRYTESKFKDIGYDMLKDLKFNVVDFKPNFDGKEVEPVVLPALIPNLFVNGAKGVAVGMKTEIPTHNMGEMIDGILAYIKNHNITNKDLIKYIPAPDFPTGGEIINKSDMLSMYETGKGTVKIRGKIEIEKLPHGRNNLIITEIPYSYSGKKNKLIEEIANAVKDKKIEGISDIRDESGGTEKEKKNKIDEETKETDNIRIVLEVKKGVDIENLINYLYEKTPVQDEISYNFLAIDNQVPKTLSLKGYIELYIKHQEECYLRKYKFLLKKALNRKEIVDGIIKAIDLIDIIVEGIRGAKNIKDIKYCLQTGDTTKITFKTKKSESIAKKEFNFTENQSKAILDMNLSKLIGLECSKFIDEQVELNKEISTYLEITNEKKSLYKVITKDLKELKKKYPDKRKTSVIDAEEIVIKDVEEVNEELNLLIDRFGYIKLIDTMTLKRVGEDTLNAYKSIIPIWSLDKLMVFTNQGKVYQTKANNLPKLKIKDKGEPLDVLLGFNIDKEEILFIKPYRDIEKSTLLFVFEDGYIKKVNSEEFLARNKCTIATKLYNSKLIKILDCKSDTEETITLTTNNKKEYSIKISDIKFSKKHLKGDCVIKLDAGDKII